MRLALGSNECRIPMRLTEANPMLQNYSVQWAVYNTWQLLLSLSAAVCAEATCSTGGWRRSTLHRYILVPALLHLRDHSEQRLKWYEVWTLSATVCIPPCHNRSEHYSLVRSCSKTAIQTSQLYQF